MNYEIIFPIWNETNRRFFWPGLRIQRKKGQQRGVFATRTLPPGTLIPFLGHRLSYEECEQLQNNFSRIRHKTTRLDYLIQESSQIFLDGHPAYDRYGLWITSLINEPDRHKMANAQTMRLYGAPGLFLIIAETVLPGQEITYFYGPKYRRKKYSPGADCVLPKHWPKTFLRLKPNELKHFNILLQYN